MEEEVECEMCHQDEACWFVDIKDFTPNKVCTECLKEIFGYDETKNE